MQATRTKIIQSRNILPGSYLPAFYDFNYSWTGNKQANIKGDNSKGTAQQRPCPFFENCTQQRDDAAITRVKGNLDFCLIVMTYQNSNINLIYCLKTGQERTHIWLILPKLASEMPCISGGYLYIYLLFLLTQRLFFLPQHKVGNIWIRLSLLKSAKLLF